MALEKDLEFQDYLAEINTQLFPAKPAVALSGGITAVIVEENDENGKPVESSIIRADRNWQVTLEWRLDGTLLTSKHWNFTGTWHVQAFLEAFGEDKPGTKGEKRDYDLKEITTDVRMKDPVSGADAPTPWDYKAVSIINAGDVNPGLYRLAVALTYTDEDGDPGPMAGFIEVPGMIQVYKPKK